MSKEKKSQQLAENEKNTLEVKEQQSQSNKELYTHDQVQGLLDNQSKIIHEDIQQQLQIQTVEMRQVSRQGPIPSGEELKIYKQVDKSLPIAIMRMAEREQTFRHRSTLLGQLSFIALVAIGFGIAGATAFFASEWVGSVMAGAVGYIAYVFKSNKPKPPKPQPSKEEEKE